MCPSEKIVKKLQEALASSTNEKDLLNLIKQTLLELRGIPIEKSTKFKPEIVSFIRDIALVEVALREFIDTLDDKESIRTRDDAEQIAACFKELSKRLKPHLVAKRAEKEFRELIEKARILPRAAIAKAAAEYSYRVIQLEAKTQSCPKCKRRMVIRESQYGLFWGCSRFPHCWGRRWLTNNEKAFLNNDR